MKKRLSQLIAFGIASILVLADVIQVLTTSAYLNENGEIVSYSVIDTVIYASIGLAITLLLIVLKKNFWRYVFLVLVIISFTDLIQFYSRTFSIGFGPIIIDLSALGLLLLHLAVNPDILAKAKQFIESSEESLAEKKELKKKTFEREVKRFEMKFQSKHKSELEKIIIENAYVPEAIEAAKRLLKK